MKNYHSWVFLWLPQFVCKKFANKNIIPISRITSKQVFWLTPMRLFIFRFVFCLLGFPMTGFRLQIQNIQCIQRQWYRWGFSPHSLLTGQALNRITGTLCEIFNLYLKYTLYTNRNQLKYIKWLLSDTVSLYNIIHILIASAWKVDKNW